MKTKITMPKKFKKLFPVFNNNVEYTAGDLLNMHRTERDHPTQTLHDFVKSRGIIQIDLTEEDELRHKMIRDFKVCTDAEIDKMFNTLSSILHPDISELLKEYGGGIDFRRRTISKLNMELLRSIYMTKKRRENYE